MGYAKRQKLRHQFLWDVSGAAGADSSAATGTIAIFSAPANTLIHSVVAHVLTAVTGSSAETVGDGSDADGFLVDGFAASTGVYPLSAEDANCGVYAKATTAGATDAGDVSNSSEKKLYGSADTIDFIISDSASAGKIRFIVDFEVLA
jgi:hypothetical protein